MFFSKISSARARKFGCEGGKKEYRWFPYTGIIEAIVTIVSQPLNPVAENFISNAEGWIYPQALENLKDWRNAANLHISPPYIVVGKEDAEDVFWHLMQRIPDRREKTAIREAELIRLTRWGGLECVCSHDLEADD